MNKNRDYIILLFILFIFVIMYFVEKQNFSTIPVFNERETTKLIIVREDSLVEDSDGENVKVVQNGEEEIIYVSLDVLFKDLNVRGDYDYNNRIAVITAHDKVIRFYGNSKRVKINQGETKDIPSIMLEDDKVYVPISVLEDIIKVKGNYIQQTNTVILRSLFDKQVVAEASKDNVRVIKGKSIWSQMMDVLKMGDKVEIIEEENKWSKVLTSKGIIGYIKNSYITNKKEISGLERNENKPIWKPEKGKIILTWEHVGRVNPDTKKIGKLEGVNVISPTWIRLSHPSGKISQNISKDYIKWAKERGYKIWVLFSNSFDPDMTDQFLNNALAREKVINDLVELVKKNNLDGINIDFENVYLKNKDELVQFVRELTPVFHENGLVVSIDVTVKGGSENWSMCYDRAALGEIVDYVALMTYDEHWSSSPVSGSVASLGWVERGIEGLLEEVPEEKLLLGIPFYTRLWTETPSKEEANTMEVSSRALGMEKVNEILKKDNVIKLWDEDSGQYYGVFVENGGVHKIWIENSESIKLKVELVNKYDLAGVAAWRRGFETEDIWNTIKEALN